MTSKAEDLSNKKPVYIGAASHLELQQVVAHRRSQGHHIDTMGAVMGELISKELITVKHGL